MMRFIVAAVACVSFSAFAEDSKWKTDCVAESQYSYMDEVEFSGKSVKTLGASYEGVDCSVPDFEYKSNGTFEMGEVVGADRKMDIIYSDLQVRPMSAGMANLLNRLKFCDITDWAIGVYQNVLGKKCGDKEMGNKLYTLIRMTETTLLLGKSDHDHDGSTPEARTTEIDTVRVFKKL